MMDHRSMNTAAAGSSTSSSMSTRLGDAAAAELSSLDHVVSSISRPNSVKTECLDSRLGASRQHLVRAKKSLARVLPVFVLFFHLYGLVV